MTDKENQAVDPRLTFDDEDAEQESGSLYDMGIKFFMSRGYKLVADIQGNFALHHVYQLRKPPAIKGITYPPEFRTWQPVVDYDDINLFQQVAQDFVDTYGNAGKFWLPLIKPDPAKRRPIYAYAKTMVNLTKVAEDMGGNPVNLGIDPLPRAALEGETRAEIAPRAWIPQVDWFDPSIKSLTIDQLLTLWPAPELDMLTLILGRAVVGSSGTITPSGHDIVHTSRMAACVVGLDPGLGKSTTFNYIFDALKVTGYTIETFSNINSRFNMGPVATADIIYKDDITPKSLSAFLSSDNTKIIITGNGLLKVEDKGIDATNIKPRGVIILNTNQFDPRSIYQIDPGTADRIKLLSTLRGPELDKVTVLDAPSAYPELLIPYLAEKLDVDQKALMLWVCRLAADRFMATIESQGDGINHLRETVHNLDHQLRMPLYKNSTAQVMTTMFYLCQAESSWLLRLSKKNDYFRHSPVTVIPWKQIIGQTWLMIGSKQSGPYLAYIKWHFENIDPCNEFHPYIGLKLLSTGHVKKAHLAACAMMEDPDNICDIFDELRLNNLMPLSKDPVWLNQAFQTALPQLATITKMVSKLTSWLNDNQDDYVGIPSKDDNVTNHLTTLESFSTLEWHDIFANLHKDQLVT